MLELLATETGSMLPVKAQPRARRNAVTGVQDGRLKVAVTEAPEKGKANSAIARILASALGVRRSQVELLRGATSARKDFLIHDISVDELAARLQPFGESGD